MREIKAEVIADAVRQLYINANTRLPDDVGRALYDSIGREQGRPAVILKTLCDNVDAARELNIPICQDTGAAVVFADIGQDVHIDGSFENAVNAGVSAAYKEGYLRASMVFDPLRRVNTGDNTPAIIHVRLTEGENIRLTVAPKGFGSENMSALKMMLPGSDEWDISDYVIRVIKDAGPNACPPMVVGVGIGGNFEQAPLLAKRALCRPLNQRNPDAAYANLERMILSGANALDIGPQGFGGVTTALAVNVEFAPTHIAGLPVAVNIGCHVNRHAEVVL